MPTVLKKVYDFDFPVQFEIMGFLENPERKNPEHENPECETPKLAWYELEFYLIGGGIIIICIVVLSGAVYCFIRRRRPVVPEYQYVEMEEIQL